MRHVMKTCVFDYAIRCSVQGIVSQCNGALRLTDRVSQKYPNVIPPLPQLLVHTLSDSQLFLSGSVTKLNNDLESCLGANYFSCQNYFSSLCLTLRPVLGMSLKYHSLKVLCQQTFCFANAM